MHSCHCVWVLYQILGNLFLMVLNVGKFKIKESSVLVSEAGWLLFPHRRVTDLPGPAIPCLWALPLWSSHSQRPSHSNIILGRGVHHVNLGSHKRSDSSVHVTVKKETHLSQRERIFLGPSVLGQLVWVFATSEQLEPRCFETLPFPQCCSLLTFRICSRYNSATME